MNARKLVFNLHLWTGLAVGLLLVSAGLSGSVLVFRGEIDALLHPELLRVRPAGERIGVQAVLDAVRAAHPQAPVARMQAPRTPVETWEVTLAGESPLQVYVDPYGGGILGERGETETAMNALFAWHTSLFAGETGERVMGTAALLLLVLVASGVVVWWPGVRRLADGFRVKWRANRKRANWELHRAGGIWSTGFLTVVAVTGASLVFHDAFMAGLNWTTRSPPRPNPPVVVPLSGAPVLPMDALVARAERALPGGELTYLILPGGPDAPVAVRKRFPEELHPNGRNFVYLHPQTGAVLAVEDALRGPAGTRAYNVLYPIHIGRWGGWVSRVLQALLGLTPLLLFGSGVLMWWNRTQAPRRRRRRAPPTRTASSPAPRRARSALRGALLVAGLASAAGCATARAPYPGAAPVSVEREAYLMGTRLRIALEAPDRGAGVEATERVLAEVRRLEGVLSSWSHDTEIGRVNAGAAGTRVPVSAELISLLQEVEPWVRATGGAFDPAVGALVDAWDLRGGGRHPSAAELAAARGASGWDAFRLDPRAGTVTRLRPGSWIDTGAWGKGAALRAARGILVGQGARSALLDFGGQMLAIGCPPEGTLAVAHPARREEPVVGLRFCNASVSTTSDSERSVEVNGERLGHVLDPRSGRPAPAWGSVTVVAEDPLTADVLSTALFVLGPEAGLAWAERRGTAALFLSEGEGTLRAEWSPAMAAYLAAGETARLHAPSR